MFERLVESPRRSTESGDHLGLGELVEAVRPVVESIVGTFPVAITYNAPGLVPL